MLYEFFVQEITFKNLLIKEKYLIDSGLTKFNIIYSYEEDEQITAGALSLKRENN